MMDTKNRPINWGSLLRIVAKAAMLIVVFNLLFAFLTPLESLGQLTFYNWLFPGRERLSYGENARESYNLSLYNLPAMINSHTISQAKAEDEFRVIIIGDSGTWGWLLENDDSLAATINRDGHLIGDGKRVVAYNLAYPIMSLTKDLMILDATRHYDPDLIIWPVTLESFPREKQLFSPIVQNNPERIRSLVSRYGLELDVKDQRFVDPSLIEQTIIGQRRNIADLFRHQFYGLSWAATGIDQTIPDEIPLRQSDFDNDDIGWQEFQEPIELSGDELSFDVVEAGADMAGDVPIIIVNEPMFISSGLNSDLRYNSFYPRWAYDQYRQLLGERAKANKWRYLDLWDSIAADEFSDTPVHLTAEGSRQLAERLSQEISEMTQP